MLYISISLHAALIIQYFQDQFEMSKPTNWNQMSSQSQQDSWFDDEDQIKDKTSSTLKPHVTDNKNASKQQQQGGKQLTSPQQKHEPQQSSKQQPPKKPQQSKRPPKQYPNKFPSDAELLQKYTAKQVDDPLTIKVVKCFNEDHKDILKKLNLKRMREAPTIEGMFILQFYENQDLLKFIQEKMANRYKFYLQLFFKGKPREGRQKRPERAQRNQRPPRQERNQRPHNNKNRQERKQYEKPRYRNDKEENEDKDKGRQKRGKQQQKSKKLYLPKDYFQIINNQNIVTIKSDKFQIEKVCQELQNKNIFKNFSRIKIRTAFNTFSKVSELVHKIGALHKWFLQQQPKYQAEPQAIIQLAIKENASSDRTNRFYQKYHPNNNNNHQHQKQKNKSQPNNNNQPQTQTQTQSQPQQQSIKNNSKTQKDHNKEQKVQSKQKSKNRPLGPNQKEYFQNIQKCNISQLLKGFDENEYIKQLKQKHNSIFQAIWNSWKIQAQDDQIQHLLKLQHRLKKSNLYDIELKPGSRNDVPVLTIQMKIRPEKERRPKVDVSSINAILS